MSPDVATAPAPSSSTTTPSPLVLSGTLHNAATGYPLADLTIQALFVKPADSADPSASATQVIGSGRSDDSGSWTITWKGDAETSQLLCLLDNCTATQYELRVSDPAVSKPYLVTEPQAAGPTPITRALAVPIPTKPLSKAQWNDLGQRATTAGTITLSTLIGQLAQTGTATPIFADWSLAQRQNALSALETAFLDPHGILTSIASLPSWQTLAAQGGVDTYRQTLGAAANRKAATTALAEISQKVAAFPSLSAVDWVIDPKLFGRGPGAAITANQDSYRVPFPKSWPQPIDYTPELGYRDYLRTQWTTMIALVTFKGGDPQITEAQALQQLRNRFHQDFTVTDSTQVAANEVLIPILTEILTSKSGNTFGFGIPAASIPARASATARAYLDTLISLSKVSAQELSLRYRTNFMRPDPSPLGPPISDLTRPDSPVSSQVWENIHTLQGFFRDSFQSVTDHWHTDPDVLGQPIIPSTMQGKAPWFLEYDEWLLLQKPIPFENYVQIRDVFVMNIGEQFHQNLKNMAGGSAGDASTVASSAFWLKALAIQDTMQAAYKAFDQGQYRIALDSLNQASALAYTLLGDPIAATVPVTATFAQRRAMKVSTLADLLGTYATTGQLGLMTQWQVGDFTWTGFLGDTQNLLDYFSTNTTNLVCALVYLVEFALPTFIGQTQLALGNYAGAIRPLGRPAYFLIGKATVDDKDAWRDWYLNEWESNWTDFPLYSAGNLPYTVDTEARLPGYPSLSDDDQHYWSAGSVSATSADTLLASVMPNGLHPIEVAYYRLQLGGAMLTWADKLYRTNQDANISRARELYKGVYFLHAAVPPINPAWPSLHIPLPIFPGYVNPAKAGQLARAQLGFTQIEEGLNFFGYAADMIPSVRYTTLKPVADAFAADAKSAERDFLAAMGQIDTATVDNMKNNAMLQRAGLQLQIAQQQAGIVADQVVQANALIAQVQQQIAQVQGQIDDHNSIWGQFSDYFNGMASAIKGAGSFLDGASKAPQLLGVTSTDSGTGAAAGGTAALGGAEITAGFGAFAVFSYITLSNMASAAQGRQDQLNNLENNTLPSANAQLDIANRNATIAGLQQQVAQSDADLSSSLLAYAQDRYLSIEFWSYMAGLFQRLMQQYLDLGARTGWLAQQALAYEQRAPLDIIGFDYYPADYQGAGGADQLQSNLAGVEAQHIAGLYEMVPIKHTYSLARDFPLQFAQLTTTGSCLFQTSDTELQTKYPGSYGYRVLAATPRLVQSGTGAPLRGVLANSGISQISGPDGTLHPSIRPADGLPITEFDITSPDLNVFGLPGSTLMQFEGSGIETNWQIDLPIAANSAGFAGLTDVLITFDLRARFSPSLFTTVTRAPLAPTGKMVMFSAARMKLAGLADLQGAPTAGQLDFDLAAAGLPSVEKTRTLTNLFFILVSSLGDSTITAKVITAKPAKSIKVSLVNGVVFSNSPPMTDNQSTPPPSPLNVLTGIDIGQKISLQIDKTANAGVDFSKISDVILGVDYTATY